VWQLAIKYSDRIKINPLVKNTRNFKGHLEKKFFLNYQQIGQMLKEENRNVTKLTAIEIYGIRLIITGNILLHHCYLSNHTIAHFFSFQWFPQQPVEKNQDNQDGGGASNNHFFNLLNLLYEFRINTSATIWIWMVRDLLHKLLLYYILYHSVNEPSTGKFGYMLGGINKETAKNVNILWWAINCGL
jgi:hypothetical protein